MTIAAFRNISEINFESIKEKICSDYKLKDPINFTIGSDKYLCKYEVKYNESLHDELSFSVIRVKTEKKSCPELATQSQGLMKIVMNV